MAAERPERAARRKEILAELRGGKRHGHKYRAQATVYAGIRYDSKAEAARAKELDLLVATGEILWWIRQPRLYLGCAENVYVPDFLVIPVNGRPWAEDIKGVETQKFKRDKRLWRSYGRLELRIIRGGQMVEIVNPKEAGS